MADELNIPTHRWYEPRNNISLPKQDFSRDWIYDSGIQKIDAWINSQPWGNPVPALFALNEPGIWLDPSDLSSMFQDRAGTTPVTTPGQSVGYRMDKSGNNNHAVANSDAARGIYGIEPLGGRRNLLTFTEQFDNAAWTKGGSTITVNATTAPDGTTTADKVVEDSLTSNHGINPATFTFAASTAYTASIYVKAAERTWVYMQFASAPFVPNTRAWFNLSDGTTGTVQNSTATITSVGNGWYRCTLSATSVAGGVSTTPLVAGLTTGNGISSYAGDNTSGAFMWGEQLELGSTATAYQRVVDQYNVTEAGKQTLHYVQYDGSDDGYVTPTIDPLGSAPELVANGNFSSGTTTGWTPNNATLSVVSGALRVTVTAGGSAAWAATTIATVPGQTYSVSATLVADAATGNSFIYAGTSSGNGSLLNLNAGSTLGTYGASFVAVGTTTFISVGSSSAALTGETLDWDNISVKEGISDKVQVFTGMRKLSDATRAVFMELSTTSSNNGTFSVEAPAVDAQPRFTFFSRGTVAVSAGVNNAIYAAPSTRVLTGIGDISGDNAILRLNGTQVFQTTTDQGICNYLAYPLYIGRRGGTTLPFNGRDYGMVVRFGANLDASTIAATESWLNQKTGAY